MKKLKFRGKELVTFSSYNLMSQKYFCGIILLFLFIGSLFLTSLLNADLVQASFPPTPLGIEGIVYNLDGLTQVFEGLDVTITNLNTSDSVIGHTGKGSSGRYSFSLNWSKNDRVRVFVSNPFHSNHTELVLEGVHRDVNLYLDMDFENVAPNITSQPNLQALENISYEYRVTAFDWNQDEMHFQLLNFPDNMIINQTSGLISWIPLRSQKGSHLVTINVSDGDLFSLQEFEIEVFVENTPPNIISEPIKSVTKGDYYEYELIVLDDDSSFLRYEVYKGAPGMYFENNTLKYNQSASDEGNYIVILDVFDRFEVRSRQIFFLTIKESPNLKSRSNKQIESLNNTSNSISIESNSELVKSDKYFRISSNKIPISEIYVESLQSFLEIEFSSLNYLDRETKSPQTRVYQYVKITPNESVTKEVKINFHVKKEWLISTDLKPDDIVLIKYINGTWKTLSTKVIQKNSSFNDSDFIIYEALSPGLSLFAITHKDSVNAKSPPISVNTINSTFNFIGGFFITDLNYSSLSDYNKKIISEKIILKFTNERTGVSSSAKLSEFGGFFYQTSILGEIGDKVVIQVYLLNNSNDNLDKSNSDFGQVIYSEYLYLDDALYEKSIIVEHSLISTHLKTNTFKYKIIPILVIFSLVLVSFIFVFVKNLIIKPKIIKK